MMLVCVCSLSRYENPEVYVYDDRPVRVSERRLWGFITDFDGVMVDVEMKECIWDNGRMCRTFMDVNAHSYTFFEFIGCGVIVSLNILAWDGFDMQTTKIP